MACLESRYLASALAFSGPGGSALLLDHMMNKAGWDSYAQSILEKAKICPNYNHDSDSPASPAQEAGPGQNLHSDYGRPSPPVKEAPQDLDSYHGYDPRALDLEAEYFQHFEYDYDGPAPPSMEAMEAEPLSSFMHSYGHPLHPGEEAAEDKPLSLRLPPGLSHGPKQPPFLSGDVVTLMVRNIPARYTQESLLNEWVPDGSFDMLYAPMNVDQCCSKGYCFLNFVSHEAALAFQKLVHGQRLKLQKGKALNVCAAVVQGWEDNILIFRERKLANTPFLEMLPALFEGKERLSTEEVLQVLGHSGSMMRLTSLRDQHLAGVQAGRMRHPQ